MNYRCDQLPHGLLEEARRRLVCSADDLEVYTWPETFGSTAGPHGGIGGQAISTFQVWGFYNSAWDKQSWGGVLYCSGVWKGWRNPSKRDWRS